MASIFVTVFLLALFGVAILIVYLSFTDFERDKNKAEEKIRTRLAPNIAQSLLVELDEMHNESDFVVQCERHSLWKKKVTAYVKGIESATNDANVVKYPFNKRNNK
ncbi:hypothetical protein KIH87_18120 [Paraneptunicella aestuarii]|uniref:hypothetical protein n=1 Tax=Paraneptunicella aestuarii TaxID=2831148 RepID=UPI001E55BF23|nr:hypothetical protein [Paraneptunicella aestuarii]UAA38558.1 hypothetical protein KIH87_18120 [Paraneptunicella aestuarii]